MPPLPFDKVADVINQSNQVQRAGIACAIWRLGSPRTTATGETFDWTGKAELSARDVLERKANRTLVVHGRPLKGSSAIGHDTLPHVALELREVGPGGGA